MYAVQGGTGRTGRHRSEAISRQPLKLSKSYQSGTIPIGGCVRLRRLARHGVDRLLVAACSLVPPAVIQPGDQGFQEVLDPPPWRIDERHRLGKEKVRYHGLDFEVRQPPLNTSRFRASLKRRNAVPQEGFEPLTPSLRMLAAQCFSGT